MLRRFAPTMIALALAATAAGPVAAQTDSTKAPATAPAVVPAPPPPGVSVKWSGYVQLRETLRPGSGLTATLNRARLSMDATLPPGWSARIQGEFAPPSVSLRDAYVRWTKEAWSVQAGQYKTPMSREYLMSLSDVETPDRAVFIDSLAPKRDLGVQLAWKPDPTIEVAAGVFNGEGQNVTANRDSTVLVMGRVAARPFAGVGLGLSGAAFGGDSTRVGGEIELAAGGAWVRAEMIAQKVDGRERRDEGWYVLAGYRVRPFLSLVARQEDFVRPALNAERSRYRATTAGLIWEPPGGRIKGLLDYVERRAGQAPVAKSHAWIAQIQGRF